MFRIEAADPYPDSFDATVERNVREPNAEARPAIAGTLPTVGTYETVLLGSGIWNVLPPMIMRTFVENVDLRGKTIFPFVTYAVSGLGRTIDDYTRLCPRATIGEGLAVRGEEVADARGDVEAWLRKIGLLSTWGWIACSALRATPLYQAQPGGMSRCPDMSGTQAGWLALRSPRAIDKRRAGDLRGRPARFRGIAELKSRVIAEAVVGGVISPLGAPENADPRPGR